MCYDIHIMGEELKRLSEITADERRWAESFLASHPTFRVYLASALAAVADGDNNRWIAIEGHRRGLILGIDFEALSVFTPIGHMSPGMLLPISRMKQALELHLEKSHCETLLSLIQTRIKARYELRYYKLDAIEDYVISQDCRFLQAEDLHEVKHFYSNHYPETVFSEWMLRELFLGIYSDNTLVAAGGVIVKDKDLASVNMGNIVTASNMRRLGYARQITTSIIAHMQTLGYKQFTLGTTADNIAACQLYESIGFNLFDRRLQFDLAPMR